MPSGTSQGKEAQWTWVGEQGDFLGAEAKPILCDDMQRFQYTIQDPVGIHARPAGLLVKQVKNYKSSISIEKDGKSVNALKLMALMGLCVKQGDTVTVAVEGSDEQTAAAELEAWMKANI